MNWSPSWSKAVASRALPKWRRNTSRTRIMMPSRDPGASIHEQTDARRKSVARTTAQDAAAAVAILREAAEWSASVGQRTWDPATFTVPAYAALAEAGELVGGWEEGAMVACMLLQPRDAL